MDINFKYIAKVIIFSHHISVIKCIKSMKYLKLTSSFFVFMFSIIFIIFIILLGVITYFFYNFEFLRSDSMGLLCLLRSSRTRSPGPHMSSRRSLSSFLSGQQDGE